MYPFIVVAFVIILWVGLTVFLARIGSSEGGATVAAVPDYNCDAIQKTALAMIISTLVAVLSIAFLLPLVFHVNTLGATRWVHHVGVVLLGIFLAAALYLQIEIRRKIDTMVDINSVQASYKNWRNITELMPAPAALMILVSGFRLIYALPGYSIGRGWIFVLITVLAIMMADGIFGYTFDVRHLLHSADVEVARSGNTASFTRATRSRSRDVKLFIHSLSFPLVVVFPALKIWNQYSPATPVLHALGLRDLGGWSQLWPALFLFAVLFLLVASFDGFGRRPRSPQP